MRLHSVVFAALGFRLSAVFVFACKMFTAFKDKAIISSMHRLHLLYQFDYVYVLKQGRIATEGTFAYLREHSAVFQELWKHQEETVK